MTRWKIAPGSFVLAALLAAACASNPAAGPAAAAARGPSVADVGRVVVRLSDALSADDRRILDEVNGGPRLETAIEGELRKAGKLREGSARVVEVEVKEFRLRAGATVFLAGLMSGVDTLQADVVVREGDGVLRRFETGDSTSGAFAGLSSSSRFQTMADALSERLAAEL